MSNIPSAGVEFLIAAIFLIPLLLIMQLLIFHDIKKMVIYMIFSLYLALLYRTAGLPCITILHFDFTFHTISFADMLANFNGSLIYMALFLPLGLLLPIACDRFLHIIPTVLFGFITAVLIEVLQIFTYRTTDLNNILTAVIGTIAGFFLSKLLLAAIPSLAVDEPNARDLSLTCILVCIVMFFMQPLLSMIFWNTLL
ncbi:MAG: VanZ family protein [Lachnospiraceae bacterium]